ISSRSKEYVAPTTELEEKLVEIWQEVLGIGQIGVTDHFFELGGDSIKAIQIASMLQKIGLTISVNHLLYSSTIKKVIPYINEKKQKVNQNQVQGEVPLTPIQIELFEQEQMHLNHFNQSMLLFSSQRFEESLVNHVLEKLVEHHDALRMIYIKNKNKWVQINREFKKGNVFDFNISDLNNKKNVSEEIENQANKSQGSLNISKGPLMKITLFKTKHGDYLLFVIHHLVIDGVSWRILLEDFETGYKQGGKQYLVELPLKTHSFLDWSNVLNIYSKSTELQKEIGYWHGICETKLLPLPRDRQIEGSLVKDSDDIIISLTKERTKQLLSRVHYTYNTEINDILLTALGITLKEWISTDKIGVLLEGHGREEIHDEFSFNRTIGWFTSCFPVVFNFSDPTFNIIPEERLSYYIKNVKETLRNIPNRGIGYGILKYLNKGGSGVDNIDQFSPEIVFNYLGQFDRGSETDKGQMFEISSLQTGRAINPDMKRKYTLEINGYVLNRQLTLLINYSSKQYDKETISELAQNLQINLERLIEHCIEKTEPEKTPSDLGDKDISLEELDYMRSMIEAKRE
ncbi:condensation domain-containing protein, partial [Lentibacillus sp. N15]|uniref:condensation domain-containing protein n=1 Tax=Lentibacillus songyuanensis TaxID=3136161 RepID=UPI0031BA299D